MTRAFTGSISTLAVIAFVFGAGVSFAADIPATPASPRLQTLAAEIENGTPQALEAFWQQVKREQAPLCEDIPDRVAGKLFSAPDFSRTPTGRGGHDCIPTGAMLTAIPRRCRALRTPPDRAD